MDDFSSRFILAHKLQRDMTSDSFIEVVQDAVDMTGMTEVPVADRTSIQSNSRCQMLHRVSRDATVGERVELWEGWHPWFRRSMASS